MTRREIRENIFKLVFCGEFHTSDELQGQVDAYFEALPEATEEERAYGKGRAGNSPACCL